MPRVLITGANRGLGLEFARQYATDGWEVIATARDPGAADELKSLAGKVSILPFDACDDDSIARLAGALAGVPLDVVIPNAGIGSGSRKLASEVTPDEWMEKLAVNT